LLLCPAPPVSTQTTPPLPCSHVARLPPDPTCGPLPDYGISIIPMTIGTPVITPAAAVLPRLESVFTQSVTSLDQGSLRPASLCARSFRLMRSFHPQLPGMISGYESRRSPYPPAKVFLSRFGTVSDWTHPEAVNPPFAVELFTVGCFGPSPDGVGHPVDFVAEAKLPARAYVERT
jgi:hypothetical protein